MREFSKDFSSEEAASGVLTNGVCGIDPVGRAPWLFANVAGHLAAGIIQIGQNHRCAVSKIVVEGIDFLGPLDFREIFLTSTGSTVL